jgi:hypothetical protein
VPLRVPPDLLIVAPLPNVSPLDTVKVPLESVRVPVMVFADPKVTPPESLMVRLATLEGNSVPDVIAWVPMYITLTDET